VTGHTPDLRAVEPPLRRLSQPAFSAAVHAALKRLHDDGGLADSGLADSRFAWVRVEDNDRLARVRALRAGIIAAVDDLDATPAERQLADVLRRTYVDPAPGQKQVAYDLQLSWSTYRRRLASAVTRLVETLWRQEVE
jgi:hypothetical protein